MDTPARYMNQISHKESFLESFDAYSDAIFRFCMVKTSNRELAEDLTQETFMRYWQALKDNKEMSNARSFLYTIARNLIIDWYRKKKAVSLHAMEENGYEVQDTKALSPEVDAQWQEVLDTIEDMEEKDREVLLLRYVEGIDPKDIAEVLEENVNVISVRIHRAIDKLQKKLHV